MRLTTPSASCSQRIVSLIRRAPPRSRCPCRRRCTAWPGRSACWCARARRSACPRIMPPVAPSGWPMAIAPPLTLTLSRSTSMSLTKRRTTAANASFISIRSMSSIVSPALASALREAGAGPVSMIVGSAPRDRGGEDARARLEPELGADLLVADRQQRGAVDDAGRVARRVDVVDRLDPVVLLQRDGVEPAVLAHHRERRLQARERLDGRAGADELVVVEHDVAR